MIIEIPDELAIRLAALLPEEERNRFAVSAIADALHNRQQATEAADCVSTVEEALAEMDAGRGLISFEEACRQWEQEKASRLPSEQP